jgi:hypothetical protein
LVLIPDVENTMGDPISIVIERLIPKINRAFSEIDIIGCAICLDKGHKLICGIDPYTIIDFARNKVIRRSRADDRAGANAIDWI